MQNDAVGICNYIFEVKENESEVIQTLCGHRINPRWPPHLPCKHL